VKVPAALRDHDCLPKQSIMKSAGVHDDTTLLLGLDGVVVDRVEVDPDGCRVVHLATAAGVERCVRRVGRGRARRGAGW
jgi:hypothetical protein